MANQLGTNPMIIDTAMVAAFKTATKVSSAVWMSPTAAGQKLTVKDSKGNLILEVVAPNANENVDLVGICGWLSNGFQVTVIEGGKLALFLC
jgi:hypothetical protein